MNKYIGAHVSASGGVHHAVENAEKINAKSFALFVKNQRQWNAKPLEKKIIHSFKHALIKEGYSTKYILPHAGYLINLGNSDKEKRKKSLDCFIEELNRCRVLGLEYLNIHPGSHLREISEETCLDLIVDSIEQAMDAVTDIKIVLENTAGQGSNLGNKFEHLAYIIKKIKDKKRIGICLDTCHMFAAGYDVKTHEGYKAAFKHFEDIVGLNYLTGIHLNDSKFACGSRKDRHESIGKGHLGITFFERFMNDPRFNNMPIILETIDSDIWKEEIRMLYDMIK
jgi:deoxyribonuclease IV